MADPIEFPGSNKTWQPAEGCTNVRELPTYTDERTGEVISCWKLTDAEMVHVLITGEIWLSVARGVERLHPHYVSGEPLMRFEDGSPYLSAKPLSDNETTLRTGED